MNSLLNILTDVVVGRITDDAMVEDKVFVSLCDVVLVDVTIPLDNRPDMTCTADVCSSLDAALDGMMDFVEVRLLLITVTSLIDKMDGVVIEVSDNECPMPDVGITNGVDVSSIIDSALVEITEIKEINVLFDATLVTVIDGINVCSLIDTLVAITDVAEVTSLLVTAMVEVTYSVELNRLLEATLVMCVSEGVNSCTLMDVALIKVTDNVEEGLLLDSPLTVGAATAVEIIGDSLNSLLNIFNVVIGEKTDNGAIVSPCDIALAEVADDARVILPLDNGLVVEICSLLDSVLENKTDVIKARLLLVTTTVLVGITVGG